MSTDLHTQNLIQMANRIGQFFESMPDHAEALAGAAEHIRKFWEPRMRAQLLQQLDAEAGQALRPFMREAVLAHRARLSEALPSPGEDRAMA